MSLYTKMCRKKQNFVNFDLQGVDMSRFALDGFDNKFSKFNLYAVGVTFLRRFLFRVHH